jgi:hypothetical protein
MLGRVLSSCGLVDSIGVGAGVDSVGEAELNCSDCVSTAEVLITYLKNRFALFLGPANFPKNIATVRRARGAGLPALLGLSALTRDMCMRCGRTVLVWKTGGTGASARLIAW